MDSPERNSPADYSTTAPAEAELSAEVGELLPRLEALLFVAPGSVQVGRLAAALETTVARTEAALEALEGSLKGRGLALERNRHGVELTTAPTMAEDVERFLELETTSRLSKAALEVLSVIAYQQPVTRPHIDTVRGVNSDSALHTLMRYGLVEEVGRTDAPGRPILYATTPDFLQYFGISSMDELPPLKIEEEMGDVGEGETDGPTNGAEDS